MRILYFCLTLTLFITACQQPQKVADKPELVLHKMFPKVTDFETDTLENGDLLVEFEDNGNYTEALFKNADNSSHKLYEVRQSWTFEQLPPSILQGLTTFFRDFEAENIAQVEKIARYTGGGVSAAHFYSAEYDDGDHYVTLELDAQGNVTQQVKTPISSIETQQKEEEGVED
jgi:hypothetical protein